MLEKRLKLIFNVSLCVCVCFSSVQTLMPKKCNPSELLHITVWLLACGSLVAYLINVRAGQLDTTVLPDNQVSRFFFFLIWFESLHRMMADNDGQILILRW